MKKTIKKLKRACLALLLLPATATMAQTGFQKDKNEFFPFSVWYSGGKARATMLSEIHKGSREEWKKDLLQIKSMGYNTVKTWVEWAHCEPRRGQYNFENLQLLGELAQEVGLRVFIQAYAESAPEWVGKAYPDALFESQNGDKVISQVCPGYCIDHDEVRTHFSRFFEEAAKVATKFPNFYGWDLWSEPHILQWGRPGWVQDAQYCYCPHTQAKFRTWLKKKYQSLEQLNKAWYRNYEDWEDVAPPRFSTILSYTDFIDWKSFIYDKMAGDLRLRTESIRKVDKSRVATAHASPVSLFSSPYGMGAEDDFLFSEQVDYYGLSQYPKHNLSGDWVPWRFMAGADFSYSANKKNGGYYVGEFQAGFGTVGLNVSDPVTSEDQRIWAWSSLATGAKGIFVYAYYPMSSGYESGGYGLINLDGTKTERSVELGKIAKFVNDNQKLFSQSKPVKASIAIVYNPLSQMVGGTRRTTTQDGHANSLIGYYRLLSEHNIPVEFIHRRDLETADLSQYQMIIVPYALMFTQKAADGLKQFINKGGNVLAEARTGWNDERGFAAEVIPGMGLSEVFGVRESKLKTTASVSIRVPNNNHPALSFLSKNDTLKGSLFAESVDLLPGAKNAQVLGYLEDGSACIVASSYGKGKTMYVGSFLGMANSRGSLWDQSTQRLVVQDSANQNTNRFLLGLVNWGGIQLPVKAEQRAGSENPLIVRLHENKEGNLLYVLNHGRTTEKAKLTVTVPANGQYELKEIISNRTIKVTANNKAIVFDTNAIGEKNAEVWLIKKIG